MSISFYSAAENHPADSHVNMCNRNAAIVMEALGLRGTYGSMPIGQFISLCRGWMDLNIDKPSAAIDTVVDGNCTHLGIPEGYVNERICQMALMAEKGKAAGATTIWWG